MCGTQRERKAPGAGPGSCVRPSQEAGGRRVTRAPRTRERLLTLRGRGAAPRPPRRGLPRPECLGPRHSASILKTHCPERVVASLFMQTARGRSPPTSCAPPDGRATCPEAAALTPHLIAHSEPILVQPELGRK